MNPDHPAFRHALALIARGASFHDMRSGAAWRVGAAAWIDGQGLLCAEMGAQHQGHVHLIQAVTLEEDGPDALDVLDADQIQGRRIVGTLLVDNSIPSAGLAAWKEEQATANWTEFWAAEIQHYSNP